VIAALWLVNTMFSLAALYVLLDAQFIAWMQCWSTRRDHGVFLFRGDALNLGHPSELADARDSLEAGGRIVAGLAQRD